MKKIKGPAIFLAQFAGDEEPFNNLKDISSWASSLGYKGVQIPSWDKRLIDLDKAAESKDYCDDLRGVLDTNNIVISELSTHLQGQLVAVHPTYDTQFDGFAPDAVKNNPTRRQEWAVDQVNQLLASKFRIKCSSYFLGSISMAIFVSLATKTFWFSRRGF